MIIPISQINIGIRVSLFYHLLLRDKGTEKHTDEKSTKKERKDGSIPTYVSFCPKT